MILRQAATTGADTADVAAAPATAPDPASLNERIERLRFKLVSESMGRLPLISLLISLFGAWLIWRVEWPRLAPAWFLVAVALHSWRWHLVRRWVKHPPDDVHRANQVLWTLVLALAALQALAVAMVFATPHQAEHYVVTTFCIGLAAGAVVATGWRPVVFALWSLVIGIPLVAGWLMQGGAVGTGLAVLIVGLLLVLLAQTRDQQRALHQMVSLAWDNEQLVASLRVERDRTQAASESKTRFFAAASHDLRQPLQALSINAYALALLARREGQPRIVKLSESIESALRQSTSLLDGLLDVSRLDAGAVQADWREIELGQLLDSLATEFRPLAAQHGLTLEVVCTDTPLVVRSDADLLRRVLTNLIGNALKFTRQGGVQLLAKPAAANHHLLVVVDTGIGISLSDQQRVFEEFYQADNPARDRNQGLGLGLAIVRRIATLLDMGLQLHSRPGQGTRVELRLPRGQVADLGVPRPIPEPELAVEDWPALGLRVLVIDDEPEVRESMQGLLEQLGCQAACAEDQASALALLRDGWRPDVLLVDHRLRVGDGLSAVQALREQLGPVACLLITGDTAPQQLVRLAASGLHVLHKPVDGAGLARALRGLAALG